MKLNEFLCQLNDFVEIVIIERHSDKEQEESPKFWFPKVTGYIHLIGLKRSAFDRTGTEMMDRLKRISDHEIWDVNLITDRDGSPYIAITVY